MAEFNKEQLNKIDTKKTIFRHIKFRMALAIFVALILLLVLWAAVYTASDVNSYKIVVSGKRGGSLSLSFDPNFKGDGFSVLKCLGSNSAKDGEGMSFGDNGGISDYVEKVTVGEIDMDVSVNGKEGKAEPFGNDEFIVSKFYLKNMNEDLPTKYKMQINVEANHKNALAAARFLIVKDTEGAKEKTVYAQPTIDGKQEKVSTMNRVDGEYVKDPSNSQADWLCNSLSLDENGDWYYDSLESSIVFELKPNEVLGYVVAVWYEGSDPDHKDSILGGYMTFNVTFSALED